MVRQIHGYITSMRMSHEAGKAHWNVAGEAFGSQWTSMGARTLPTWRRRGGMPLSRYQCTMDEIELWEYSRRLEVHR